MTKEVLGKCGMHLRHLSFILFISPIHNRLEPLPLDHHAGFERLDGISIIFAAHTKRHTTMGCRNAKNSDIYGLL